MSKHYIYLYRSTSGVPMYVGYGEHPERAMSHAGASHNQGLRDWLAKGDYQLTIAGAYRDEKEAKAVEAGLISALAPKFNVAPGDGPRFLPLGVPTDLADRPSMPPLDLVSIGKMTGGALLVYLAPGDFLSDGRKKFDPANPRDEDVLSNIEGVWDIGNQLEDWAKRPELGPRILVGVHGNNVRHRFIVGAIAIDTSRWADSTLRLPDRRRWRVPLQSRTDLDAHALRGRRVEGARFGQFSWQLHKFIDSNGEAH